MYGSQPRKSVIGLFHKPVLARFHYDEEGGPFWITHFPKYPRCSNHGKELAVSVQKICDDCETKSPGLTRVSTNLGRVFARRAGFRGYRGGSEERVLDKARGAVKERRILMGLRVSWTSPQGAPVKRYRMQAVGRRPSAVGCAAISRSVLGFAGKHSSRILSRIRHVPVRGGHRFPPASQMD